jgi:hypothetical protein
MRLSTLSLPAAFADKLSSTASTSAAAGPPGRHNRRCRRAATTATATTVVELTVVHWRRKRGDLLVDKAWDKDVLLFKRWRSRRQPPPAVTTLYDGWLLRSLLSRRISEHHQQLTNGSTILFTFTFPVNLDLF